MSPAGMDALWRGAVPLIAALVFGVSGGAALAQGQSPTVTVAVSAPTSGTVVTAPGTIEMAATASVNRQNWAILRVEFYSGAQLIGTATTAPFRAIWAGMPVGIYTLTAKAIGTNPEQGKQDPAAHSNMPAWEGVSAPVTVIVNAPPTVALAAPAANAIFDAPANITVSASAADSDGSITKVDFYHGVTLIGTAASAPYIINWTNVAPGMYSLTAKATDNHGASVTSAPVTVTVNAVPIVSIISPTNNATYPAPAIIALTADATDSDGAVSQVEFFANDAPIGAATAAPFTVQWANVAAGSYSLTARATDNGGAQTTSAAVAITVVANNAPTVRITSPANNATFTAPANITLTAEAADSDGTVTQVEFFHGTTLITTVTAAPYSVVWTGLPQGSYALTAVATDNLGATITSAPVSITVNVAVASTLFYIHTDHLNTPRLIANQTQQVVWQWDNIDPFGGNPPNENPSGLGNFTCNLRLPGQYFDWETGTHYNYFRDYDPGIGRYVQSDPIGLRGGINTYAYIGNNPIGFTDPRGLDFPGMVSMMKKPPVAPPVPWGWGCGDVFSDRYVPDSIDGVSFMRACRNHDVCYETCGANKAACDRNLFDDIVDDCFASGRGVGLCLLGARAYFAAMSTRASQNAFNKAQQKCGRCSP